MNMRRYGFLVVVTFMPLVSAWSSVGSYSANTISQQKNEVSPYIDLVLCPIRAEPWSCARQQSGRVLDVWDNELHSQWQNLKVEADRQLNATLEKRGYSASEVAIKEKPSTILKKIEIGTKFMKEFLAETMDGFLGREYDYLKGNSKSEQDSGVDTDYESDDAAEDDQTDDTESTEDDASKNSDKETSQEPEVDDFEADGDGDGDTEAIAPTDNTSNGVEFIEIEDSNKQENGQLKRPDGKKKKKKGQSGSAPGTVVVLQQAPAHNDEHDHSDFDDHSEGGHGGGKPLKQKRKKRKKHQHGGGESVVVVEEEPNAEHHIGLGLLEDLVDVDADDLLDVGGGKRKRKHPSKYGRSNGVTRGKKKKKKKLYAKLILLGSFLKAKIELLLKILGAHLQIKFFAIALIGLLINIARFWIDVKRGGVPQKVVYVEHAHHQHHYEDHGGDEWSEPGGYWKRSLQTEQSTAEEDGRTDSYQLKSQQHQQPQDAHYMAYRGQWQ